MEKHYRRNGVRNPLQLMIIYMCFGSTSYYHVKESKFDPRAKKALFMGITSGVKGYHLWCIETRKMIFRKDVTFDVFTMLKKTNVKQSDGNLQKGGV